MGGIDIKALYKVTPKEVTDGSFWSREFSVGNTKLSDRFKEGFFLELATMLEAGMDLKGVLDLMEKEYHNGRSKEIIAELKKKLISGTSLYEALRDSNKFSPYEYYSVKIGEETGELILVAYEISSFYTRKIRQRKQIISALSYPAVILLTTFTVVGFMLGFIVPMFTDIYKRFNGELPYLTRIIVAMAEGVRGNFFFGLALILLFIIAAWYLSKLPRIKRVGSMVIIKVPLIGHFIKSVYLARFSMSLALLVAAKVPLLDALKLVRKMIGFYPVSNSLQQIEQDILNGSPFYRSLEKHTVFSSKMIAMIKIGEEVNKLDSFLERIANQYTDSVDQQTQLLNTFMEPLMIIILGFMVGIILIAMYLPMFELSTGIM